MRFTLATVSVLAREPDPEREQLHSVLPDLELAAAVGVLAPALAARETWLGSRLRARRWRRYGRVVVTHNGPLTSEQVTWVALLRSPRGAVLAAETAAVRRGLRWPVPARPQLLVPAAGPFPHLMGVDVRRSHVLGPLDVHPTAQPPQLRLPRAVVDAAVLSRRADDVRALLCAPVQQRLLHAGHLREAVHRLGPLRHRALVLRTLLDVENGAHSTREIAFGLLLRRAALPPPSRQVVRRHRDGRRYLDAVWERQGLHVEIDGLGHLLVVQWGADCDRTNELELGVDGSVTRRLRFPGYWLDERPEHVLEQVRRGLVLGRLDGKLRQRTRSRCAARPRWRAPGGRRRPGGPAVGLTRRQRFPCPHPALPGTWRSCTLGGAG